MAKRGQPALYEMMRTPRTVAPSSGPAPIHEPAPSISHSADDDTAPSPVLEKVARWLTPGRVIRFHVGYVFLVIGVALASILLAYAVGFSRGESEQRSKFEQDFAPKPIGASGKVNDPLESNGGRDGGSGLLASGRDGQGPVPNPATRPAKTRSSADWGSIEPKNDPRVKGWNYYVLAETTPQGATRLAEFCRSNGLETYVVPANNGRRKVIAFPGFQGSALSAEATAIKERIISVGVKFKRQNKNAGTDLSDAYPTPYGG